MFCGNAKYMYYEKVIFKALVSWSDLVLFCGIDEETVICRTGYRETFQVMHLFVSVSLPNCISIKTTSGYIALIVVFCNEYETNLHFIIICLDYRTENNMKMTKISSTESPLC